jgi:hypothetical protein
MHFSWHPSSAQWKLTGRELPGENPGNEAGESSTPVTFSVADWKRGVHIGAHGPSVDVEASAARVDACLISFVYASAPRLMQR